MKKVAGIMIGIIGIIAAVAAIGWKTKERVSISVIGGTDGPTSIFLAGKIGGDFSTAVIIIGIILVVVGIGFVFYKRR